MIIFAWIILIVAAVGFVSVWLMKLPIITNRIIGRSRMLVLSDSLLSYLFRKLKMFGLKLWHAILEAKDLKLPLPISRFKSIGQMTLPRPKNAFRIRIRQSEAEPVWMPEATTLGPIEEGGNMEQTYLESIKRNPNDVASFEGLARLYLQNKNFQEAAEVCSFLVRLEPKRDFYWSNLGLSLFSVKKYRQARDAYEHALNLNDKIPVRWINLALCLDHLDDTIRAVKAITQAVALDPRNINYQFLLADMYMKIENKVRAEEVLEQVLRLEPTNKPAREKLMKIRV